ncbi:MAG: hypothetical protein U0936_26020 [Planctomycetaceae bacterium]
MDELQHECGVAAVYHLNSGDLSPLIPKLRRKDKSFIDPATEDPQTVRNHASRLIQACCWICRTAANWRPD